MKLQELTNSILTPIFFDYQVYRLFSKESQENINVQLSRFEKRGEIVRLKRGVYKIATKIINEYYLSNLLYQPSYVSLESALNYYGIIPDVSINVTAISLTNSKKVSNTEGVFIYSKINNEMFFGWTVVKVDENIFYKIATPEKALLDYIYIRKIKDINPARVDMALIDILKLNKIIKFYPNWVGKVFHE